VEQELGGQKLTVATGVMAKQANGAAEVRFADTVVLATAVWAGARPEVSFLPLTVEYREMTYAAGKFPGGFYKREGRPTQKEILTMRLIDRSIRPLFPKGLANELQVIVVVLSADKQNDPDVLALNAASAALAVSDIPFQEPVGCVRVGLVDNELVLNPTHSQREGSALDLVVAGTKDKTIMVEAGAREVPEDRMVEAILFGQQAARRLAIMLGDLAARCGKPKGTPTLATLPAGLVEAVQSRYGAELERRCFIAEKTAREEALGELRRQGAEELSVAGALTAGPVSANQVGQALDGLERDIVRRSIREGRRVDGRGPADIRPITCEVSILPRTHGSALFTRGETQALVVTTLGTAYDEQRVDGLLEEYTQRFMVHYNFPPFCVGEVRPVRGPSRREVGHGALAERALQAVVPPELDFPYTIRVVSDILESNGSSSMATVCGGTLSLMDAGVPISDPVAGVAMGLVEEGGRWVILSDIIGAEDFFGDMDFKVAGTQRGITALQLDVKAGGLNEQVLHQVFAQAREGRLHVLRMMLSVLAAPRQATSEHAPKVVMLKINPEKIGAVIGPGGRVIRKLQEETDSKIEIDDDGTISIAAPTEAGALAARKAIEDLTAEVEVGKVYTGRVTSVKDFGAFVEVLPGREGLVHISELADTFVENVADVTHVGAELQVKVIGIDDQNRIRLSRKAVLRGDQDTRGENGAGGEPQQSPGPAERPRGQRHDRRPRGGGGGPSPS
jgi:polyribonucleotide nucleotidyltransferase